MFQYLDVGADDATTLYYRHCHRFIFRGSATTVGD
jgi:hypothetical protein